MSRCPQNSSSIGRLRTVILAVFLGLALPALAADASRLLIVVQGIESATGEIGCALYAGAEGFPLDDSKAVLIWQPAQKDRVECAFEDLPEGAYAVAVSHDLNQNRQTDKNFFGIPKEAWGVSNNVRPRLRAPRFDEASFDLSKNQDLRIEIEVSR